MNSRLKIGRSLVTAAIGLTSGSHWLSTGRLVT
jgi:hypothetical protein